MKTLSKLLALTLALLLVLGLPLTAMAATIEVTDGLEGETYNAYKIFDVSHGDTNKNGKLDEGEPVSYWTTTSSPWWANVLLYMGGGTTSASPDSQTGNYSGKGITLEKTDVSGTYTVTVAFETEDTSDVEFDAAAFAKFLIEHKGNISASNTTEAKAGSDGKATITVTEPGYYLVDSSLGALCALKTDNSTITLVEKNTVPTLQSKGVRVVADSDDDDSDDDDDDYYSHISADYDDIVEYQLIVKTGKGNSNDIVIHDTIDKGLELVTDSASGNVEITVKKGNEEVAAGDAGANWEVTTGADKTKDTCAFHITLKSAYISTLPEDTELTITYQAKVTSKVKLGTDGNVNKAWLVYSAQNLASAAKTATVYSYSFDIAKVAQKKNDNETARNLLDGAEFKLYRGDETEALTFAWGTAVDGKKIHVYNTGSGSRSDIQVGAATIRGLAAGTYYLEETKAPAGYNRLTERVKIEIVDPQAELTATAPAQNHGSIEVKEAAAQSPTVTLVDGTGQDGVTTVPDKVGTGEQVNNGGVIIENATGSELPSTGGIGTTIFYVVGGLMMAGAVVLLITKKKMSGME